MRFTVSLVFCCLFFGASFLMAASNHLAPMQVAGTKTISVEEAKKLHEEGKVLFVDVRSLRAWKQGRIPHAVHLDLAKTFSPEALEIYDAAKKYGVVIYCNGPRCLRSSIASAKAVSWGYHPVYYFREGFPGWVQAHHPISKDRNLVETEEKFIFPQV